MDYTREQRREAILALDPELKEALLSDATEEATMDIVSKHSIQSNAVQFLSEEIANVLCGLRHPNEFISTLQRRLAISGQAAQLLANDINNRIFKPVRIPLLKLYNLTDTKTQTTPASTPTTAPITPITPAATPSAAPQPTPTVIKPIITAAPTPIASTAAVKPAPSTPKIPTIVPPPGIGMPIKQPEQKTPQQSQFVQYQPLKQNPFEIKPVTVPTPTPAPRTQPLNPNTLNSTTSPVHTLKEDIKQMSIVQQKLNSVVSAPKKTIEWTKPEIKIGSNGSYTVDPYREPPQP